MIGRDDETSRRIAHVALRYKTSVDLLPCGARQSQHLAPQGLLVGIRPGGWHAVEGRDRLLLLLELVPLRVTDAGRVFTPSLLTEFAMGTSLCFSRHRPLGPKLTPFGNINSSLPRVCLEFASILPRVSLEYHSSLPRLCCRPLTGGELRHIAWSTHGCCNGKTVIDQHLFGLHSYFSLPTLFVLHVLR